MVEVWRSQLGGVKYVSMFVDKTQWVSMPQSEVCGLIEKLQDIVDPDRHQRAAVREFDAEVRGFHAAYVPHKAEGAT